MHTRGYVYLRAEGHPRSRGKGCYVAEHILVAEATTAVGHYASITAVGFQAGYANTTGTTLVNVRGRVYRCEACGMFVAAGHEDSPSIDQVKL